MSISIVATFINLEVVTPHYKYLLPHNNMQNTLHFHFPWMNATRISYSPSALLQEKIHCAIDRYEDAHEIRLGDEKREVVFSYFHDLLENFEEYGKVADVLTFVDDMLINYDYDRTVREVLKGFKKLSL